MGFSIRYAEQADVSAILPLMEQLHTPHHQNRPDLYRPFDPDSSAAFYRLSVQDPAHIYLLAEEDGQPLGYAHILIRDRKGSVTMTDRCSFLIEEICVHTAHRCRGVGRALITEIQRLADIKGAAGIVLCVWAFNRDAMAFYQKIGFRLQSSTLELPADHPREEKIEQEGKK